MAASQAPQNSASAAHKGLSLAQAIFVPFEGFEEEAESSPFDHNKPDITKILENVPVQQDLVRCQIITAIEQRSKELTANAEAEIRNLPTDRRGEAAEAERSKNDLAEMMERIRTLARLSARSDIDSTDIASNDHNVSLSSRKDQSNLEVAIKPDAKLSDFNFLPGHQLDADGDTNIGEDSLFVPKPQTASQIREKLELDIQDLIRQGAEKLKSYDNHASGVFKYYQNKALSRKNSIPGLNLDKGLVASPNHSVMSPGANSGTIHNAGHASPVDNVRRLSSGMPVFSARPSQRNSEAWESISRR